MLLPSTFLGLLTASTMAALQPLSISKHIIVSNAYIVQLNNQPHPSSSSLPTRSTNAHERFHRRAANIDYSVRKEFQNPSLFLGLSINLNHNLSESKAKELLHSIPDVVSVWPVYLVHAPNSTPRNRNTNASSTVFSGPQYPAGISNSTVPKITGDLGVNSAHMMSDIDKVHTLGIKGKGIKIGIIDTGVDYRHPSLGRGFGIGYKISGGHAFVNDDFHGFGDPGDGPDPLATCYGGGHGSHVSGLPAP